MVEQKEFETIGRNKYNHLKHQLDNLNQDVVEDIVRFRELNNISVSEAESEILKYETKFLKSKEQGEKTKEYFKKILNPEVQKKKKMTKDWIYKEFKKAYRRNEGVNFLETKETIENIKPLIYYFIGDFKNFKNCKNVSGLSVPDFRKGLLIIGEYGNGKTSILRAIEDVLKRTNVTFKGFSANELVKMYEQCNSAKDKSEFDRKVLRGVRYFDDVLTERQASNYGKSNIIKDIIEERYNKSMRTYISCNYKDFNGERKTGEHKLKESLKQFQTKYGNRVFDRIFAMFNIIEFKGGSFRK